MTACHTCPRDDAPFMKFGRLVLCRHCASVVTQTLADAESTGPTPARQRKQRHPKSTVEIQSFDPPEGSTSSCGSVVAERTTSLEQPSEPRVESRKLRAGPRETFSDVGCKGALPSGEREPSVTLACPASESNSSVCPLPADARADSVAAVRLASESVSLCDTEAP